MAKKNVTPRIIFNISPPSSPFLLNPRQTARHRLTLNHNFANYQSFNPYFSHISPITHGRNMGEIREKWGRTSEGSTTECRVTNVN